MEHYLYNGHFYSSDELYHWGIKGMKWGVRRYQNKDGSLTPAGKKRLAKDLKSDYDANRKHFIGQPFRTSNEYNKKLSDAVDNHITDADKKRIKAAKDKWKSAEDDARDAEDILDRLAEDYGKKYYNDELKKNPDSYDTPRAKEHLYGYAVYDYGYEKARKSRPDLNKKIDSAMDAFKAYTNECKTVSDTILGEYGNTKLTECKYYSLTIRDTVGDIVQSKSLNEWKL